MVCFSRIFILGPIRMTQLMCQLNCNKAKFVAQVHCDVTMLIHGYALRI